MTVYSKMVQAYPRDSGWCEYPDGHLRVRIFYSGSFNKCPVEKNLGVSFLFGDGMTRVLKSTNMFLVTKMQMS